MSSSCGGNASSLVEFNDELAYALSCIRHIREHVPDEPAPTNHQKKHLRLLDGIALLLATGEKGDVAAVSFLHTAASIEFYYSKNRPYTPKETEYIRKLLDMVRCYKPTEKQEWVEKCVGLALQTCIKKLGGRLRKITNELRKCGLGVSSLGPEDINDLPIWCTADREGEIGRVLLEACPQDPPDPSVSDKQILVRYFRMVLEMNRTKDLLGDFPRLFMTVMLSFYIGLIDLSSANTGVSKRANFR
jgi:hypothetical protein